MAHPRFRQAFILTGMGVCLAYLTYRYLFTLNLTTWYAAAASLFLLTGETFGILSALLYFLQVWDVSEPPAQPPLEGRTVDVLVPTYNEDVALLRATLQACQRMDYPHQTYVLDDGRRPEVRALADELGVGYITRADNRHAKAGNLNNAFEQTHGEFVIIFDADHVPEKHFITRLLGYFRDERLGYVQTPHAFYNFDSFQARLDHKRRYYWEEGELFYQVIQPGRNRWGCPIFAGSAAMFRRKALEDVGYIAVETITEDLHTGLRINARGWKALAISERLIAGQAAPDVTTFHSQRLRWGTGNLSIMAYDNPLTMPGLTLAQRLCYFGSMMHWAGGLFKLAIYLTPLLMLFTGVPPVAQFTWALALITVFYLIVSWTAIEVASNGHGSFLGTELFTMVSFWTQVRATFRALFRRGRQQFIVTSKRGRQTKRVWPLYAPHLTLIGLSVLALLWGWWRVLFQISDDYNKPLVASLWAVFHICLAAAVVRRALWPENHRYAYRHAVNLPVGYAAQGGERDGLLGYGVTVDLNETGLALVAYEALAPGTLLDLAVRGGGEAIHCQGQISWAKPLGHAVGNGVPGGYRYGVAFRNLTPPQSDALYRLVLQYAVPRLYHEYGLRHRVSLGQQLRDLVRGPGERRSERRFAHRLPLVLNPGAGPDQAVYAITEDLNRSGLAVVLDADLPVGSEHEFLLATPLGDIRGTAQVVREQTRRFGAWNYHHCVLHIPHFEGQGRLAFQTLNNPKETPPLRPVLAPVRQSLRVPLARPAALALLAAVPLALLGLGAFRLLYHDDFFLRDVAQRDPAAGKDREALARVETIYAQTVAERYPATDRLVLLQGALARVDGRDRIDQLTELLAPRDRGNLDLQIALVHAFTNLKDYDKAEAEYQKLQALSRRGALPLEREQELLLAAARSSVHAGKMDVAIERFGQLLERYPEAPALRNEFAGVLINAGRYKDAVRLYDGRQPDLNGQWLLVTAHALAKDFDAAEQGCRAILKGHPGERRAELLLADVLSFKKGFAQSRQIYERLLNTNGDDPEIRLRLAYISLTNQNYKDALETFQTLLDAGVDTAEVRRGWVDAAASADAKDLGEAQRKTALAISGKTPKTHDDPIFLARLAWVLQRVKAVDKCPELLGRAVELAPENRDIRLQYAGVLVALDRPREALRLLEGDEQDLGASYVRVGIYVTQKNFAAAEKECRALLKARPGDPKAQRLLADVLSWKGDYKESLALFEQLAREQPTDRELPVRLAEVTLWSRDYPQALKRFQALLEAAFDQPALWPGFVDAAAGSDQLTAAQSQLAVRLADRKEARESGDLTLLTRLGWVLYRLKDQARADVLFKRAMALNPKDPAERKELADVLAATGRSRQALEVYAQLPPQLQDHYLLASLYSAVNDFAQAEKECRALLKERPDDKKVQRLLADVLSWKKEYKESLALLEQLGREDPANLEIKQRIAEVALWSGDRARALPLLQAVLEASPDDPRFWPAFVDAAAGAEELTPAQLRLAVRIAGHKEAAAGAQPAFLTRLAWVLLDKAKDPAGAAVLLDRAVALKPTEPALRRELAGVLATAGKSKQALQLYEGLPPTPEDRYRLADLYAAEKDFPGAERQCRALLKEKPGDKKALRLLADVLSWNKDYKASLALLEQLAQEDPKDAELQARIAEVTQWSGDNARALTSYQALLESAFAQPRLWPGYVAAAAGVEELTEAQGRLALAIAERPETRASRDALYLARLGWVLVRINETARATVLFDRAVALDPREAAARKEMAGVLAAARQTKLALKMYEGVTSLGPDDHLRLAGLYAGDQDFTRAEQECRLVLRERPGDRKARRLLADVLSWKHEFKPSLALMEELLREDPKDRELPVRLAEVTLWSGEYDKAVARYEVLLEANFEQPPAWKGFVDAVASAEHVSASQGRLALRIADSKEVKESKDPLFLTRLAWVLQRTKQTARADALLDRVLALRPQERAVRRELAGVLAAVGKNRQAVEMYEGLELDFTDQVRLANLLAADKNFDAAEKAAREGLRLRPSEAAAQLLLADILSWNKKYQESLRIYQQLLQANPEDAVLPVRLARVTLWSGDYDDALERFAKLLRKRPEDTELWGGYIDAAASADEKVLTDAQKQLVLHIYEKERDRATDPTYLARLGWVLRRVKETDKGVAMVKRALDLDPDSRSVRLQYAEALYQANKFDEAEVQFRILLQAAPEKTPPSKQAGR